MWDKEYQPVVLSLFDGISCGQEALKRVGIKPKVYLSSEIEKFPICITKKNFPETIQLGDVQQVFAKNLPKIDLLLAGSPCQGFSFAGSQLAFDHPQSKLFFEFTRILEECRIYNPNVKFLLENVPMKKEFLSIITEHVGVEPVMINSALVSAQNRKRWYWTNIPGVDEPSDQQINLIDVLEQDVKDQVSDKMQDTINKNLGEKLNKEHLVIGSSQKNAYIGTDKSSTLTKAMGEGGGHVPMVKIQQPKDKGIVLQDVLEDEVDASFYPNQELLDNYDGGSQLNPKYKSQANTITKGDKSPTIMAGTHGYANGYVEIKPITQPADKGILLKDVLENGVGDIVTNQGKTQHKANVDKASTLLARDYKGFGNQGMTGVRECELKEFDENSLCHHAADATDINGHDSLKRVYADSGKAPTLNTQAGGNTYPKVLIVPEKVRVRKHEVDVELLQHCLLGAIKNSGKTKQQVADELDVKFSTVEHYFRKVGSESFSIPSEEHWMPLKKVLDIKTDYFDKALTEFEEREGRFDMADRVHNPDYKAPTVVSSNVAKVLTPPTYRRLTVKECSRLQTFHDDYLEDCYDEKGKPISNSQKYKALGNGWTIDVIAHIFKGLNSHQDFS